MVSPAVAAQCGPQYVWPSFTSQTQPSCAHLVLRCSALMRRLLFTWMRGCSLRVVIAASKAQASGVRDVRPLSKIFRHAAFVSLSASGCTHLVRFLQSRRMEIKLDVI